MFLKTCSNMTPRIFSLDGMSREARPGSSAGSSQDPQSTDKVDQMQIQLLFRLRGLRRHPVIAYRSTLRAVGIILRRRSSTAR